MIITLEEFKKGEIAINTKTQKEYDNLMKFFDSKDIGWDFGKKATERKNYFYDDKEDTCIYYQYKELYRHTSRFCERIFGFEIITPTELKEYNEFMGGVELAENIEVGDLIFKGEDGKYHKAKPDKYITTKQDFERKYINIKGIKKPLFDEIISKMKRIGFEIFFSYKEVSWGNHYLLGNGGILSNLSNFSHSFFKAEKISIEDFLREEETQYLTIGQAIDYMLESEDNVIEYYDKALERKFKEKIVGKVLKNFDMAIEGNVRWYNDRYRMNDVLENWTNIKKHIEPKQKTLKELIQAKEPFQYKDNWYRFNKDGAIIDNRGSAVGLELIKEILKEGKK